MFSLSYKFFSKSYIKTYSNLIKLIRVNNFKNSNKKSSKQQSELQLKSSEQSQIQITQSKQLQSGQLDQSKKRVTLIRKTYQQLQISSFQQRRFTNLTQFQRNIIQTNKFDLISPQIKPKILTLNQIPGLMQKQQIASISLGNIKVKNQNEVYLSEIDPYNIPEDYQIRFDIQKELTLVGKKVKKIEKGSEDNKLINSEVRSMAQNNNNKSNTQMSISTAESFQQKTIAQLSQKYMGQIGYKYQFNRRRSFKQFLLFIPFFYLFFDPVLSTLSQVYDCLDSIKEIQQEEIKEIKKIKKQKMVKVILDNKDFNVIVS